MHIKDIREMSDKDLLDALEDKKAELWTLRFQKATGELKDTNLFRSSKRDIARLKTALRERELAAGVNLKQKNKRG